MATSNETPDDILLPGGRPRAEEFTESALEALQQAVRLARETRWDRVRSPHLFMGLLVAPDDAVANWGERLQADLPRLLCHFQELFHQPAEEEFFLTLHREFLSDNVIRLLREAQNRARDHRRARITRVDLLISLLTAPRSIVGECFERIGVTAAKLTELAVLAEHTVRDKAHEEQTRK